MVKQGSKGMIPRKSLISKMTERPDGKSVATSVRLPLAYLRILETEAARLGLRRGAFLTLLLNRKRGEVNVERAKEASPYTFSDKELMVTKLYLWYLTPEVRKHLEEDRRQMGLTSISSWITQTLNHWIGRPEGLRRSPS